MKSKLDSLISLILLIIAVNLSSCSDDDLPDPILRDGVFETTSGTATIEGELFLPQGEGPFPTMIIIPGSGNETRDELEPIAQILTQNGYATYLYDKRGIGGSTGSYPVESLENYTEFLEARADDVLGIIELLTSHTRIDYSRIGIYGSSQGAWVNTVVFSRTNDLSYIVMASGGVASVGLENLYCSLTDDPTVTIEEATSALANYTGIAGYDPLSTIQSMTLPVLWIYGNQDRSHPARYDIDILNNLSKPNFTVQVYPNADHELIDQNTGMLPTNHFDILGQWLVANN